MDIYVVHKSTGNVGILESATYFSDVMQRRVCVLPGQVVAYIGRADPPCRMIMRIRLTGSVTGTVNTHPKNLMQVDNFSTKPPTTGCKSIW